MALLAFEMGLGKTAIAIRAADIAGAEDVVVFCPSVAVVNWQREFARFGKLNRAIQVISYSMAHKYTVSETQILILDECHYLKSIDAVRTKAILGKGGHAHAAFKIWCLSGTPAPNHAGELWPLLFTLGITPLKYDAFVQKYCDQRSFKLPQGRIVHQISGTKEASIPDLRQLLKGVMLRKKKEEVLDLPPLYFENVTVQAGEVDFKTSIPFCKYVLLKDTRDELFEKLEHEAKLLQATLEIKNREEGLKALEAIANSVSTLRMYSGCQKIEPVAELIRSELEANAYNKLVVFAIHRDVIEGLRDKLRDFRPVTLYGGTPPESRQKNIDKFQTNPRCRVFIGNIHSAGTAITLTAAHHVLFVEQDWVPGNNAQAAMRCHRIGQTKTVHVRFVSLDNAIDEKVNAVLRRKMSELAHIFDKTIGCTRPIPTELEREFTNVLEEARQRELSDILS